MQYMSLVFDEDIDKTQLASYKRVPGCIGISSYKNTLNLYFKTLSRASLFQLALVLQKELSFGESVSLQTNTLDEHASTATIYEALREEAAI